MRASPQCHDLPLQPAHAVVLKFLHGLYVLVAGTDSRVHLLRILAQHRGARPCSSTPQLGSRTGFNLPSVLHRSVHMVPQQPALLMTMPWPARVQTIAANSRHRNAPSGQSSVTRGAYIQTTVVRTTRAPLGAPACVTLGRVQARDCRNIEPNQVHISNTNCIAAAAHRALRVSQRLRRFPRKTLPNRG